MPHLLVMDEITTHLDFHAVIALASALSSFNGALLLVSHDRYLIRTVIEGLRNQMEGADHKEISPESDEVQSRRRDVYVLNSSRLNIQTSRFIKDHDIGILD